jgi:hypothetical protein
VGSGDNYYLTDAVYFAQKRLEALQPAYCGEVLYGDRAEHCWNGDPHRCDSAFRCGSEELALLKSQAAG